MKYLTYETPEICVTPIEMEGALCTSVDAGDFEIEYE